MEFTFGCTSMKGEVIRLENVSKKFGEKIVLSNVSMRVYANEIFGIFGPSGCGKTTLLRIIAGLEKPDRGKVYLRGKEVFSQKVFIPPEKRNVSLIFQDLALWPHLSVREHLEFVLGKREGEIERIIRAVELVGCANLKPESLSGGEKQRLAIARALAQKSDILLLDEPLASLDLVLKEKIKKLLVRLRERNKLTLVYVSHDILDMIKLCERVALMSEGKIKNMGKPGRLLHAYIGKA